MKISQKEIKHIAKLAKLEIDENDVEKFTNQLTAILELVEKLNEVDTEGIEPTYNIYHSKNFFREDIIKPSLEREKALSNAEETTEGHFVLKI
ncbi:aspartyl/glutamyl-tRNA(Asn/Gln) amidotransferase subunit C [Caloranaerobacter azorensis DSM 13643]|uniref:Aspartyl/glutamyl-tRNA(Asn/Gln) amidotransferase subunit C n=1 Tax=Caloranaerobacter azorensis DSM 13643 TaxID=1121264 RepID=A0A1M5UTK5_9FIRM|nr:Asp-tRNA(Asn)/Glu-tRNA(Gln) amidotransferase subunit GatC [Caloranaerobacter azorensis]SHH66275.1 aspartyl/glutamyl-tRNA(Asn/Gln) amidotransferase subunit C [Caloranaerobacter azorensis DSM 13643]